MKEPICKSVFKDGKSYPAVDRFTQIWINMINRVEKRS